MNLFKRSALHLNLTPGERAFLKLLEGFAIAGFITACLAVAQALALPSINWSLVGKVAAGAFAVGALMAVAKYYKAKGDPALADAVQTLAGYVGPLPTVPPSMPMGR